MNHPPETRIHVLRNGELLPTDAPVVSMTDSAMIQGHGLFETIPSYIGKPFALAAHLERLEDGCRILGLRPPSRESVASSCGRVLEANGLLASPVCRLRITIAGGREEPIEIFEATPAPQHPESAIVVTGPFVRNERGLLSGIKTLSYGENAIATRITKEQEATEALWSNSRNELCEGTWSNVFVRVDGRWKTPPLDSGCLPGITRSLVLTLAHECGIEVTESPLRMDQLEGVESGFLTSSIREIQPVSHLDGRPLESTSDPEIKTLREAYCALVEDSTKETER